MVGGIARGPAVSMRTLTPSIHLSAVVPAKARIQYSTEPAVYWIPAFAG